MPAAVAPTAPHPSRPSCAWAGRPGRPQAGGQAHARRRDRRRPPSPTAPPIATPAPDLVARQFSPLAPTACGSLTSPSSAPAKAGATSPSSSTRSPAGSSAGRWPTTCAPSWSWTPWTGQHPTQPAPGLVHHPDHGCQDPSLAFGRRLTDTGLVASMGTIGDALANAVAESCLATLECELLDRHDWPTRQAYGPPCSTSSRSSTTANAATRPWTTPAPPPTAPAHLTGTHRIANMSTKTGQLQRPPLPSQRPCSYPLTSLSQANVV